MFERGNADELSEDVHVNAMPNFLMEFYTPPHGVVVTFDCRTELNYLRIKVFLLHLVGGPCSSGDTERTDPIFYYIENEQQKEALYDFLPTLR